MPWLYQMPGRSGSCQRKREEEVQKGAGAGEGGGVGGRAVGVGWHIVHAREGAGEGCLQEGGGRTSTAQKRAGGQGARASRPDQKRQLQCAHTEGRHLVVHTGGGTPGLIVKRGQSGGGRFLRAVGMGGVSPGVGHGD